jgi:Fe-S cluster biosynthesis and repair protein YggX
MSNRKERIVECAKLGEKLPGLEQAPFPGGIGRKIYDNISKKAWMDWCSNRQLRILSEFRLNMGLDRDFDIMMDQMQIFLNLKRGSLVELEEK